MPRLNAALRQMTENAQERSFGPIPAGKYVARLTAVEAKQSQSGNPYWNATYQDLEALDGRKQPGSQWLVLNLPDDGPVPENYRPASSNKSPAEAWRARQEIAASRLKSWFHAHGFTVDSDTEEMIGSYAMITVVQETIQRGQRAGQVGNRVTFVEEVPAGFDEPQDRVSQEPSFDGPAPAPAADTDNPWDAAGDYDGDDAF